MNTESFSFAVSAVSAFAGAMSSLMWSGWWMRGNISDIHQAIKDQEIKNLQRFADLRLQIVTTQIQIQTIEGVKRHLLVDGMHPDTHD